MVCAMRDIIVFKAACLHDNVNLMTDQLGLALGRRGYVINEIDLRQPDAGRRLVTLLSSGRVTLAISLTGFGLDTRTQGNIYALSRVPVLSIYLDPVLLYWDQISVTIPRRVITTISPADLEFCHRHLPGTPVSLLPHSAPNLQVIPWDRRDVEVFFAGSVSAPPETLRAGWRQFGPAVESRLNAMVDALRADPTRSPYEVVETVAAEMKTTATSPTDLHPYVASLDSYMRMAVRWQMVESLRDQPVTIAGSGWDALAAQGGRARFLGPLPIDRTLEMIGRSKMVLNCCTPWHGSHERLFYGMSAGAAVVTTWSAYAETASFADSLSMVCPPNGDIAPCLERLLSDDAMAAALAEAGWNHFRNSETWDHRAAQIEHLMGLSPD